jgi:hypothetical protein
MQHFGIGKAVTKVRPEPLFLPDATPIFEDFYRTLAQLKTLRTDEFT